MGSVDQVSGHDGGARNASIVEPLRETELADAGTEPTEVPRRCDPVDERLSELVYHATAENDPSEIEKCRRVADRQRKGVDGVDQQLLGHLVALLERLREVAGLDRSTTGEVDERGSSSGGGESPGSTFDAGPSGVGLEMSSAPAAARIPTRSDGDVTDFTDRPSAAFDDRPAEDHASTHARSDEHGEQIVDSLPGPETVLGDSATVHVIGDHHRDVDELTEAGSKVDRLIPAGDVGTANDGAVVDDEARDANAYPLGLSGTVERADGLGQGSDDIVGSGLRGRNLPPPLGSTGGRVDEAGQDLRAPEIDADVTERTGFGSAVVVGHQLRRSADLGRLGRGRASPRWGGRRRRALGIVLAEIPIADDALPLRIAVDPLPVPTKLGVVLG